VSARAVVAAVVAAAVASCGGRAAAPATPAPAAARSSTRDDVQAGRGSQGGGAAAPTESEREAEQIAAIEYAMNTTGSAVHACYKRATAERYRLDGQVVLAVQMREGGAPAISVLRDETGSEALGACLIDVFTALRWPPVFHHGERIELPLSFVAPPAQYTVARQDVTAHRPAVGLTATVVLDADSTGNAAAALTLLELAPGFATGLRTHASAEILYVVRGGGTLTDARGARGAVAVRAGAAMYVAAGVAHAFAAGEGGAVVVQLYAPGGPEQRFEGHAPPGATVQVSAAQARALARARHPRWPHVMQRDDAPVYTIAGGNASVRILFDARSAGDDAAYVGVLTGQPSLVVPAHAHARATEVLYVLAGEAVLTVNDVEYPVRAGMGVQLPPGATHALRVTSRAPLEAVQFYTPSGPEQRFKR